VQYEIDVTNEDIREGVHGSAYLCPVARAVSRAIGIRPELGDVLIGPLNISIPRHRVGRLPDVVSDFIRDFDQHRPVHPFQFRLSINPRRG
jgi:hypothetical protein